MVKRVAVLALAGLWAIALLISLAYRGWGLGQHLPRLFASPKEKAEITSGDPEYHRFLMKTGQRLPAGAHLLLLTNDPDWQWQNRFHTDRASYELYPTLHWYLPVTFTPPAREKFEFEVDRSTLDLVRQQSIEYAAIFVRKDPDRSGVYHLSVSKGNKLLFDPLPPAPPTQDRPDRFAASRPWGWPVGVATLMLFGWVFNSVTGLSGVSKGELSVRLALALLSGAGLTAWWMLLLSLLGFSWNLLLIVAPWGGLLAVVGWQKWKGTTVGSHGGAVDAAEPGRPHGVSSRTWLTGAGWALIGIASALAMLEAFIPISAWSNWDAWAIWNFKVRAFWEPKTISQDFLQSDRYIFTHPDYPPGLPLIQTYLALWAGGVSETLLRLSSPLFHLALVILLAALLHEVGVGEARWLLAAGFALTPKVLEQASNGYVDLPVAATMTGALLQFVRAGKGQTPLWTVGLLCGLGTLMKNDAIILSLGCLGWMGIWWWRKRVRLAQILATGLLLAALIGSWHAVVNVQKLNPTFKISLASLARNLPDQLPLILRATRLEAFGPALTVKHLRGTAGFNLVEWFQHLRISWLLFWYAVATGIAFGFIRLMRAPGYELAGLLLFQVGGTWVVYLAAQFDVGWLLLTSLDRLLLQMAPLALVVGAVGVFPLETPGALLSKVKY